MSVFHKGSTRMCFGIQDFEIHYILRGLRIADWISRFQYGFCILKWILFELDWSLYYLTLFLTYAVPPPDVQFALTSPDTITYTGNSVTLNCRITLVGGVTDSDVAVNSTWTKDGAVFSGFSGRVTVLPQIRVNSTVFLSQVVFSPSSSSIDSGTYTCVVTLTSLQPELVTGAMRSKSITLSVRGKVLGLLDNLCMGMARINSVVGLAYK